MNLRRALSCLIVGAFALTSSVLAQAPEKEKTWGEATLMVMTASTSFSGFAHTSYMLSSSFHTNLAKPQDPKGTLTVPGGLGIGPVIPLAFQGVQAGAQAERLYYWGCGAKVGEKQPEVHGKDWRAKDQWWTVRSSGMADAAQMMNLTAASPVPGTYTMKANYVGEMSLNLTPAQQFLPPLKVLAPATDSADTSQPIAVSWEPVEGAAGYLLMAFGKNKAGKEVTWESAYHATLWQRMGAEKALKEGKLLPPTVTSCTIPAGIFDGQVSLTVTGVSPIATGQGVFSYWGWAQTVTTRLLNMGA